MSFTIHSQTAAPCPTHGVQERNAQDRRHPHRSASHGQKPVDSVDSRDLTGQAQVSSAIRRNQDTLAVLSDALIFLQTQDQALASLQDLFQSQAAIEPEALATIAAESFNGIALFGPAKTSDTIRFEDLETQDAAEIERPAFPAEILGNTQDLASRIAEAREKNHREQMHIEKMMEYDRQHAISEEFHLGHLTTPVEATRAADISLQALHLQGRTALEMQANAQQESVLRLFY
ncbi:MAG: hypothetical protein ACKOLA_00810 [Spartobacteria bacterium]